MSSNSGVVCLIDCLLNWTLFCQNPGFGTLRVWPLTFFLNSMCFNIFSYRADTSIPTTFVDIGVVDSNPVAYLRKTLHGVLANALGELGGHRDCAQKNAARKCDRSRFGTN